MVSPNPTKTQPGNMDNLQLQNGKLKHLIAIEGLGRNILTNILDTAESFTSHAAQPDKKIPLLRNKTIANLFFENSTRTRISFEIAASRLSANILHVDAITSSHCKGESMLDTVRNLEAMFVDMFVVRHNLSGTARFIAEHAAPATAIINAGDGSHAHPTQAILDLFTIRQHKPNFAGLKIGIIGDILHSRVARSQIEALRTMGVQEIRVIAPETLCPKRLELLGVTIFSDMAKGLADLDVVIMLRLQKERMADALLPSEHEYFDRYGLTTARLRLAKPDAIVMHPGPINRGVEISSDVADGNQSVILQQARNGVAVRMAIISLLLQNQS